MTERGWIILSKDGFRYSHEKQAISDCAARVFMIPNGNLRTEYMVERFTASREEIFTRSCEAGPYLFAVHPSSLQRITLPDPS